MKEIKINGYVLTNDGKGIPCEIWIDGNEGPQYRVGNDGAFEFRFKNLSLYDRVTQHWFMVWQKQEDERHRCIAFFKSRIIREIQSFKIYPYEKRVLNEQTGREIFLKPLKQESIIWRYWSKMGCYLMDKLVALLALIPWFRYKEKKTEEDKNN